MPDLSFEVDSAEAVAFAAAPIIVFKLRAANSVADEAIHSVVLRCQIRIEAVRRRYGRDDQENLIDLFGEPERWSQTLRSMLWTQASVVVPAFQDATVVDLPIPCTFDFNVAATKYFAGLADGEVPLLFLFSGAVFYANGSGDMQVAPISWDKEARFTLPVKVWRDMMDLYYPDTAWLSLRRDTFERLRRYKAGRGIPTWEQALETLLHAMEEVATP